MAFINKTSDKRTMRDHAHANFMGGPSYDITNPILRLRVAASSCFFGEPMYYHVDATDKRPRRATGPSASALTGDVLDRLRSTLGAITPRDWYGLTPAKLMESAIDAALAHDVEATLQEAVRLRNEDNIRVTPQVILVRAANHAAAKGTGLVRQYGAQIVKRADEPATGLAYQLATYGEKAAIPMQLRKVWKDALERFSEYQLAKYRQEARGVKTVDVVNLVHPKSDAVNKLVKGELKTTDQTWESIISQGGSTPENWAKAIDVMGHMALLRNIRNLLGKGLDPKTFSAKLVEGAEHGKQLPFRYYSAYQAVKNGGHANGAILDAIEACLMKSIGNLPRFEGRTMSLTDNSGSAHGAPISTMSEVTVAQIGNLSGILTGMASEDGYVGVFGDRLETFPVRKASSVFDQLEQANQKGKAIGAGTENGIWLFWDQAIKKKEHWDNVFIYSDQQAGHGGLYGIDGSNYADAIWGAQRGGRSGGNQYIDVPKLIAKYRREVNPNVKVFLVQVAGYQDTIVPEIYDGTYILGGWSDSVLKFAAAMGKIPNGIAQTPSVTP